MPEEGFEPSYSSEQAGLSRSCIPVPAFGRCRFALIEIFGGIGKLVKVRIALVDCIDFVPK